MKANMGMFEVKNKQCFFGMPDSKDAVISSKF